MTMADMPSSSREDGLVGSRKRPVDGGRPKRRTFTAAYKLSIVEAYDQLSDPGERGALLRREGLYHSHIQKWREARDQGALEGVEGKPAGRPKRDGAEVENARLKAQNAELAAELARTKAALEVVGKAHALLELISESAGSAKRPAE
jgi:transposase